MATSDSFPRFIVVLYSIFYGTVFIMSTVGNTWVIVTCYKTLKRRHFPLMWLVANLASADLLFTFLTILNAIGFIWRWVGGDSTCKLQGFLVEATYTTSITTLVVISYQRLKAITDPFNARISSSGTKEYMKPVIIWVLCLAVCSPLVHIYRVDALEFGYSVCVNTTWGNTGRQIYYSLHAIFFFVIPLLYMILTQTHIHRALRTRLMPLNNFFIDKTNQRHKKVAKTLAALTIAFATCWSPFMITRTLMYFHLASPGLVWRASQLLICLNAGIDPLLYGYYGGNLKSALRRIVRCNYPRTRESTITSMVAFGTNASMSVRKNIAGGPNEHKETKLNF